MATESLDTLKLHHCIERWRQGDRAAADELLRSVADRMEHLTRRMLRGFPNVRRLADTADVCQGSLVRLLHSLRELWPESTRDFFNLAAVHVRRELLDLARRFSRREHVQFTPASGMDDRAGEAARDDLEVWSRFHEAAEQLPAEQREVVGLVFYHGWTQAQVAELLGVDERTVRRYWRAASLKLAEALEGRLPGL